MKPGRELDALVDEKVMGFDPSVPDIKNPIRKESMMALAKSLGAERVFCSNYSTDIATALLVVEKVKERTMAFDLFSPKGDHHWVARFYKGDNIYSAGADTASHAICLAALKAVNAL